MKNLPYKILSKEPVLLGAAAVAVYEAAAPHASSAWKLAVGAIVAWGVRVLSTPEARARERIEEAKYVGAVEHQALAALTPPRKPARARSAAAKAPANRR